MNSYFLVRADSEGQAYIAKHTRSSLLELLNQAGADAKIHGSVWFVRDEDFADALDRQIEYHALKWIVVKGSVVVPEVAKVAIAYDLPRDGGNA
jgi:hypothetical protein